MRAFWSHYFLRCVIFICSFLIWIFIKKSLIDKRFYFWETFDFWNLEVLKLTFKILRLWNLEILIWNLKFEILRFKFLKIKTWNFDHEIWGLDFLKTEDLSLKFGHWEYGIENLGMKILNWKFRVWKILENFEKDFFFWVD